MKLGGEPLGRVVALEDVVPRAVGQRSLLPRLLVETRPPRLLDDDEARSHAQRFADEVTPHALCFEVAVDVRG